MLKIYFSVYYWDSYLETLKNSLKVQNITNVLIITINIILYIAKPFKNYYNIEKLCLRNYSTISQLIFSFYLRRDDNIFILFSWFTVEKSSIAIKILW